MGHQHCLWVLLMAFLTAGTQEILDVGPVIYEGTRRTTYNRDTYILNQGYNYTFTCEGRTNVTWIKQKAISQEDEGGFFANITPEAVEDYETWSTLELVNVNEHAVGYYACRNSHEPVYLNGNSEIRNDLLEEPNSTENITYIYIYVNGTSGPFADMSTHIMISENSRFVIPCRPTVPNNRVDLIRMNTDPDEDNPVSSTKGTLSFSPKLGFIVRDRTSLLMRGPIICRINWRRGKSQEKLFIQSQPTLLKEPHIKLVATTYGMEVTERLVGETLVMNCTVEKVPRSAVNLKWLLPNGKEPEGDRYAYLQDNMQTNVPDNLEYYKSFQVSNVLMEDAGRYTCVAEYLHNKRREDSVDIKILEIEPLDLNLAMKGSETQGKFSHGSPSWGIRVTGYPVPNITVYKNMDELVYPQKKGQTTKYIVNLNRGSKTTTLRFAITDALMEDTANYTIVADNGYTSKNITVQAIINEKPKVSLPSMGPARFVQDSMKSVPCRVSGNPLPQVIWTFRTDCQQAEDCLEEQEELPETGRRENATSPYVYTSILDVKVSVSGNLTCKATNANGTDEQTMPVLVYQVEGGFGIEGADWFARGSEVWVSCVASKYDYYDNLSWYKLNGARKKVTADVVSDNTALSYVRKLHIKKAALEDAGTYECVAQSLDQSTIATNHTFVVEEWRAPTFLQRLEEGDIEGRENLDLFLNCTAEGVPRPNIRWFHNGVEEMSDVSVTQINNTVLESTLTIRALQEKDLGKYECRATGGGDGDIEAVTSYVDIKLKNRVNLWIYLSVFGVIMLVFLILISYLLWKIRKEKQYRKRLYQQFNEGNTQGLNPKLAVDEQADLLPYDKKFEFPIDRLILKERLGEGAFGEVYKAEARGIIDAEVVSIVAVKKTKRDADSMYIKALESELKIMIHLGRHLNILNLLGACTKKIASRELMVIVEYCRFGNIHNYIQKHREVFIDQLTDSRNHLGNGGQYNRAFSRSSANSGENSDYFGSERTPVTGHTIVNSAGTSAPLKTGGSDVQLIEFVKGSDSDYIQPKWRSNYQSDYEETGITLRPLHSRDLMCWAFQIARGMEYLASRKVLHGDLAARNILLAEDNVVKICDFGLARSMQKNDVYQKESNDPVPLKWLALECIKTKTFSTQSDVWSYGVVLWELFSLGRTPYPGFSPQDLLEKINNGYRLEKPKYANEPLYEVMRACWHKKPDQRPSFTELQERIGLMLEENVRNHYVDLNSPFMASNEAWRNIYGATDYLAMMQAPEYRHEGSVSTPTPTYQNQSFFPQPATDADGYLQVSPCNQKAMFTPRSNGDMFNFERRPRLTSEKPLHSNELTPMLSTSELAHRGSDSEHEHDGSHSPYMRMKPSSIVEEDDGEVFAENMRNNNTAVENPSYHILIEPEDKRPAPGYVNIIPNQGLVN